MSPSTPSGVYVSRIPSGVVGSTTMTGSEGSQVGPSERSKGTGSGTEESEGRRDDNIRRERAVRGE